MPSRGLIRRVLGRRPAITMVAMLAAVVAAAGIAWAVVPDSHGVFTGCYSTTSNPVGQLRVIDPSAGQSCTGSEVQIKWNVKGINWTGAWSSATTYRIGDAVARSGSS